MPGTEAFAAPARSTRLLSPQDPPPFSVRRVAARWPALIVCDHASPQIPESLEQLGLPEAHRRRHIAWDIGAGRLAEALSAQLQLPLVQCGYSRLVIDCNRPLAHPGSILAVSDDERIPGNESLSEAQRRQRIDEIFLPYHQAIEQELAQLATATVEAPALLAIHSFTPLLRGAIRPWHCGILWDRDPRIPVPLMRRLREEADLEVGDNEPYSGRDPADYTIDTHAEAAGQPHACIEVRQDLIAAPDGVEAWAARLARALQPILDDPALYVVREAP